MPNPQRPSPTRGDRRSIAYLTIAFIALSTIFHFTLGDLGARGLARFAVEKDATPEIIEISRFETPPPSRPTPPPTPAPTPSPRAHQQPVTHEHHEMANPKPARHDPIVVPPKTPGIARSGPPEPIWPETSSPGPGEAPGPFTPRPLPSPTLLDKPDMIVAAQFIHRVQPDYPSIAATGHWEGTVVVLITLGPDGVIEAKIGTSSGYAALDRAALRAAEESTYRPPEINGTPAIETYRVIYTFTLSDA